MTHPHFLESAPLELLVELLWHSQTLQDVLSFSLTCRHMWNAWQSHETGLHVAWGLIQRQAPAAKQALAMIRTSKLAYEAFLEQTVSPSDHMSRDLGLQGLSSCLPNSAELTQVLSMETLAKILLLQSDGYDDLEDLIHSGPESPEQEKACKDAMYRAVYRSFIASAYLSSVYMEPIRDAQVGRCPTQDERDTSEYAIANAGEFAVYRMRVDPGRDHDAFGTFGDWLLQDILDDTASKVAMQESFKLHRGRALGCEERSRFEAADPDDETMPGKPCCPLQAASHGLDQGPKGLDHADAHLVALELMRLLWVCGNIADQGPFSSTSQMADPRPQLTRTYGPVFLWGTFEPELIDITALEQPDNGSARHELHRREPDRQLDPEVKDSEEKEAQVEEEPTTYPRYLLARADKADYRRRELAAGESIFLPPTRDKFFVYFLHRHLRAAFKSSFFEPEEGQMGMTHFYAFIQNVLIFARDDGEDSVPYCPDAVGSFAFADFLDGTEVLVPWGPLQDRVFVVNQAEGSEGASGLHSRPGDALF